MSVYFVQPKGGGHIKVGCSSQVDARYRALSRLFPYGIDVLAVIDGERMCESFIHSCFRPIATAQEWFRSTPAMWRFILDIHDHGRPVFLPSEERIPPEAMQRLVIAHFGTPEKALLGLGYSPFTSFDDTFSGSSVAAGGRARFAFHMALIEGRLPSYIADLHAPVAASEAA
jgi:hypothetical protein